MKKETFKKVGAALFGPHWQTEIAEALKVNSRTVRRWISGEHPVPEDVTHDVLKLMYRKMRCIYDLMNKIRKEDKKETKE